MLRELRAAWTSRVIDETFAWTCLVANVTILPGLGTLAARRHVPGVLQAALALLGAALSVSWLFRLLGQWVEDAAFPWDGGPYFVTRGLLGVFVFGMAWLSALVSSLSIVRRARPRT